MSFLSELKRRNVIRVALAYLVMAWLLVQVASVLLPAFEAPAWVMRVMVLVLAAGFVAAIVFSWVFELTPEGLKREHQVDRDASITHETAKKLDVAVIAMLVVAVGFAAWLHFRAPAPANDVAAVAPPPAEAADAASSQPASSPAAPAAPSPRSIAVLPFVNMSGDAENGFFADGLSEEILNSLTRIDGMQVAGRTSSFQFRGQEIDLRRIGEQLGVACVLEGSVRRGRDAMRVTAQLVRASDGIHLWSQTYDRAPDDTLGVQLDIAERVAGALDVVLDDAQRERMREAGVKNVDAFIAFQKGRKLYAEAHDARSSRNLIDVLREANVAFARATELEPDFAAAYYLATDFHNHVMFDAVDPAEQAAAREAARSKLALAARHAHEVPTRLLVEFERQLISDDWRGLAARLEAASAAQGCRTGNWLLVGNTLGLAASRLATMKQQVACDPLSPLPYVQATSSALWLGDPEAALEIVAKAEATMGGTATTTLNEVRALLALDRTAEAQAQLASMPDTAERLIAEMLVTAATGGDVAALLRRPRDPARVGWNAGYWDIADLVGEALLGDRAASTRRVAGYDAEPGGPLKLVASLALCMCGAPFDLDATPNFKARLAESGFPWPPPDLTAHLRKPAEPGP